MPVGVRPLSERILQAEDGRRGRFEPSGFEGWGISDRDAIDGDASTGLSFSLSDVESGFSDLGDGWLSKAGPGGGMMLPKTFVKSTRDAGESTRSLCSSVATGVGTACPSPRITPFIAEP